MFNEVGTTLLRFETQTWLICILRHSQVLIEKKMDVKSC